MYFPYVVSPNISCHLSLCGGADGFVCYTDFARHVTVGMTPFCSSSLALVGHPDRTTMPPSFDPSRKYINSKGDQIIRVYGESDIDWQTRIDDFRQATENQEHQILNAAMASQLAEQKRCAIVKRKSLARSQSGSKQDLAQDPQPASAIDQPIAATGADVDLGSPNPPAPSQNTGWQSKNIARKWI